MRAIRTVESNFTYLGPTPDIADLPVKREEGRVYGVYEPTEQERQWLADGAQIQIGIWQEPMPPISMEVVKLEEAAGQEQDGIPVRPDYRCRTCDALYIEPRAIALGFKCGHCGNELRLPGAAD